MKKAGVSAESPHDEPATNWIQVALAVLALLLGTLVYVLGRPVQAASWLGDSLPTFSHVFAFSLLTAAWLGGSKTMSLAACLTWLGIDAAFEMGQHPQLARTLVERTPAWFESLPMLHRVDSYFIAGTFDLGDLTSIVLGAVAAYLLIRCTAKKEPSCE